MKFGSLISFLAMLLCFTLPAKKALGQGLEQFRWKNRILLLLSQDLDAQEMESQLRLFEDQETELDERKLILIKLAPQEVRGYHGPDSKDVSPQENYSRFKRFEAPLEHVLIGLDGSVKLHGINAISPKELYGVIDAMPMRQAELDSLR